MKHGTVRVLLAAALILGMLVLTVSAAGASETKQKKATVIVYMCGTDLEAKNFQGTRTISDMNQSGFNKDEVNIVALLGGSLSWMRGYDTSLLTVLEMQGRRSKEVDHLPLSSMGDPRTMSGFLEYCVQHYPADRYYLVIWDHGGGPNLGVCFDALFESDSLSVNELAFALQNSPFASQKLAVIAFHTCLTGSMEYAVSLAPYAEYMVATEDSMYGLTYDWLKTLDTDSDPLETAVHIVDGAYQLNEESYRVNNATEINSVTAVDLGKIGAVADATDSFFRKVVPDVSEADFVRFSNERGNSATFGVDESGGSSNRDLADFGDLVTNMREHAPEEADLLLSQLREAVVYNRSARTECYGLTVYHPYRNKEYMKLFMTAHNEIQMSEAYSAYIRRFASILTGTPLADWTGMDTSSYVNKDLRTLFSLKLTEEQLSNMTDAGFVVLEKAQDESFRFVCENSQTTRNENLLTSEYPGSALYAVSGGSAISLPLEYRLAEGGVLQIPALLTVSGKEGIADFTSKGIVCCTQDSNTHALVPGRVLLWDEASSGYTGIFDMKLSDFSDIVLPQITRRETRDERGVLLRFRDWEVVSETPLSLAVDESWSFMFLNDTIGQDSLYASFQVTDAQQNHYSSELTPIRGTDGTKTSVTYDDMGILRINTFSVSRQDNGSISVAAELENLSDQEAVISLEQLKLNQTETDVRTEVYGSGENWGLMPHEKQYLAFQLTSGLLPVNEELKEITFILVMMNPAAGEMIGTVPVTVDLLLQ